LWGLGVKASFGMGGVEEEEEEEEMRYYG